MSTTLERLNLTRDRVIDSAADIAARDGIEALSMRTLAAELDVSTMAAYRHVESKWAVIEALLLRALDEAQGLFEEQIRVGLAGHDRVEHARTAVESGWAALERYDGLRFELRHESHARNLWADWMAGLALGYGSILVGLIVGQRSISSASAAARAVVS